MKIYFIILTILFNLHANGQKIYYTEKDVVDCKEIIFYGYDFSHFKLAEAKRINSTKVNVYVPAWVGYVNEYEDEKTLTKRLKKDKVIFDFDYTTEVVKNLQNEDLVSIMKNTIPSDSIQSIISKYNVKQNEGIGFVVIVECFEKANKTSTAYFTFFDIATKTVLVSDYFGFDQASGTGLTKYWGNGLATTFYQYLDTVYRKRIKSK